VNFRTLPHVVKLQAQILSESERVTKKLKQLQLLLEDCGGGGGYGGRRLDTIESEDEDDRRDDIGRKKKKSINKSDFVGFFICGGMDFLLIVNKKEMLFCFPFDG
jgi:hypothetical protein